MQTWHPISLSGRQKHAADRVGGIDLILAWPEGLPAGSPVALGEERDATQVEHAAAEAIVGASCRAAGLVPVRSVAAMLQRPSGTPGSGEIRQHLVVTIIGERWVHAKGRPRPQITWSIAK